MSTHPFIPLADAVKRVVDKLTDKELSKSEDLRGLVIAGDIEKKKEDVRKIHGSADGVAILFKKAAGDRIEAQSNLFKNSGEKWTIQPFTVMEIYVDLATGQVVVATRER